MKIAAEKGAGVCGGVSLELATSRGGGVSPEKGRGEGKGEAEVKNESEGETSLRRRLQPKRVDRRGRGISTLAHPDGSATAFLIFRCAPSRLSLSSSVAAIERPQAKLMMLWALQHNLR